MVCYFTLTFLPKAVTYKMGLGIYHILDHYVWMNKNYMYNTFTGVFPTVLRSGVYIDLQILVSANNVLVSTIDQRCYTFNNQPRNVESY